MNTNSTNEMNTFRFLWKFLTVKILVIGYGISILLGYITYNILLWCDTEHSGGLSRFGLSVVASIFAAVLPTLIAFATNVEAGGGEW